MALDKHVLSKSSFIRSLQCLKSLYLYKHRYHLRDKVSAERQALFNRGTNVGILAQQLFPGGIDVTPESPFKYRESVEKTETLIKAGETIIYEAAFQFEQILVAVDLLVKTEQGWNAYEVKSATRISPTYILDSSIQFFVIENAGLPLNDFFIVTINNSYVRAKELDVKSLFNITTIKKEVVENQKMIFEKVVIAKETLKQKRAPDINIGEHCFSPYACDFMGFCWGNINNDSVFNIAGMSRADQFQLYKEGITTMAEVPDDRGFLPAIKVQIDSFKKNTPIVQFDKLNQFINEIRYPVFFLDFETFMPPVPIFEGTKPYQHIPFLYSLHRKNNIASELEQNHFLAEPALDQRKQFLISLIKNIGTEGIILVYDGAMEKNILNQLATLFPEYLPNITNIISRIRDMMLVFQEKWFYHPDMKGSNSMKNVLPALVPELDYSHLSIKSGVEAMVAYENLGSENNIFKQLETREALLEYCKMDTLGMVKIFEYLNFLVQERRT